MRICVFCGSSSGSDPIHRTAATELGRYLAEQGIGLVFGGGRVGLMGAVADAALAAGGEVIGVIPQALLDKEVGHRSLTELRVVGSMHERKALMSDLADGGYIALPGGLGTFEELFEVWTWAQLGYHPKPVALLNTAGFYDGLLVCLDHTVAQGFIRPLHRAMLLTGTEPAELLARMAAWEPPQVAKWIKPDER